VWRRPANTADSAVIHKDDMRDATLSTIVWVVDLNQILDLRPVYHPYSVPRRRPGSTTAHARVTLESGPPADAGEELPQPQRAAGVRRERRGVLARPGAQPVEKRPDRLDRGVPGRPAELRAGPAGVHDRQPQHRVEQLR
jgi:hypothetical protein